MESLARQAAVVVPNHQVALDARKATIMKVTIAMIILPGIGRTLQVVTWSAVWPVNGTADAAESMGTTMTTPHRHKMAADTGRVPL